MEKAIFLDRDGTIIIDKHYLKDPGEIEFLPGAIDALKELQTNNFKLYIITNQSGIGRGYFTIDEMHAVHRELEKQLEKEEITLSGIAYCPHSPDDHCDCRKPSPKLINQFIISDEIDPSQSYMIGDKKSDVDAGINAKMQGILLTENPSKENEFKTLLDFVKNLKH